MKKKKKIFACVEICTSRLWVNNCFFFLLKSFFTMNKTKQKFYKNFLVVKISRVCVSKN